MEIKNPYMWGECDNCKNNFLLDGDESRCRATKNGISYVMCAQVAVCNNKEEYKNEI